MSVLREDLVKIIFDVTSDPLAEVNTAVDSIVSDAEKAVKEVSSAVTEITSGAANAAEEAVQSTNKASGAVSGFFKDFTSGFAESFKEASNANNLLGNLASKVKSIPIAIIDKLKNGVSKVKESLKKLPMAMLNKLKDGLKAAEAAALTAAKNIASMAGKAAFTGIAAGSAAAVAGITMVTKAALEQGAAMEQNIGGIETLFGTGGQNIVQYAESQGKAISEVAGEYNTLKSAENEVLGNARTAWKTAGLSANEYMETVTGFSASLISSLGGDTMKAAKAADVAITDMADNANKMGTPMESIQNAYAGFAKGQYNMLDNLKLGGLCVLAEYKPRENGETLMYAA